MSSNPPADPAPVSPSAGGAGPRIDPQCTAYTHEIDALANDGRCKCGKLASSRPDERSTWRLYEELLYAVGNKFPGESRHETALRYIRTAEAQTFGPASVSRPPDVSPPNGEQ